MRQLVKHQHIGVAATILTVLALVSHCAPTFATTLVVGPSPSAPFVRIQDAIDAASPGDTLLVKAGYYVENLDFRGNSIVLRSESGPENTTIDGRNADDSVIKIMNGEDTRTTVEGFTITGGRGYTSPKFGGGILVLDSSCVIRDNVFVAIQVSGLVSSPSS